eukprot:7342954-Alexandrium_andersonii.AAC.2
MAPSREGVHRGKTDSNKRVAVPPAPCFRLPGGLPSPGSPFAPGGLPPRLDPRPAPPARVGDASRGGPAGGPLRGATGGPAEGIHPGQTQETRMKRCYPFVVATPFCLG